MPLTDISTGSARTMQKKKLKEYIGEMLGSEQMKAICVLIDQNLKSGEELGRTIIEYTHLSRLEQEKKKKIKHVWIEKGIA